MGGKSKLFDPDILEPIYLESVKFNQNADTCMRVIHKELREMNDRSFVTRLLGEEGDDVKQAIDDMTNSIEELQQTLVTTRKFIESKLAGAAQLAQEKRLLMNASRKTVGFEEDSKLKK